MSLAFIHPGFLWLLVLLPLTAGLALLAPRGGARARFWGALALRLLLLLLIVLALAGIQLRTPVDTLTTVFVLDFSDSLSPEAQARGEDYIRAAVRAMPASDQAAIVVFGEDALVEQLPGEHRALPKIASLPVRTRTNIAGALQLALALFPNEGAKRIVLLSDGRENLGQALEQAELAAAHGVELSYVPLGSAAAEAEALIESLEAPSSVRQGQNFTLRVQIYTSQTMNATLRVFADGTLLHGQEVSLKAGSNRFEIPVTAAESGFRRFEAQIVPDLDTRLQNNRAAAFTVVQGPPRVLILEGRGSPAETESAPNSGAALAEALSAAQMQVELRPAASIPTSLTALAGYDAVILADVPVTDLPPESMEALEIFVRDLGRGLVMTGGERSFGAGGYLRTPIEAALPVYMDVRNKQQEANLALVLAVDKSGSMGRCHCNDPDLNQTYTRSESGQAKVDIAKEAVMQAAGALGALDYLGVVAFDSAAHWAVETQQLPDPYALEHAIGGIPAEGGTNLQAGVQAAYDALAEVSAERKHIILLTDGWVHQTALLEQAAQMRASGVTLSVVAAGSGSAEYLKQLAERGGGTYYPAANILEVPDFFLKETVTAVGRYIIETPFYPLPGIPGPALTGLNPAALPPLYGYNGTTPKGAARLDLITPQGDPLLATWQYGLGRSAAWTSDMEGRWAAQWLAWEGFPRFAAQLVGWVLPAPQPEGLTASTRVEETRGVIELQAVDESGAPRNYLYAHAALVAPDLTVSEVALTQIGPGRYRAEVPLAQPGVYLVRLGVNAGDASLGQQILGLVMPYSPEYRLAGVDLPFLGELARLTGGGALPEPDAAFLHTLTATANARQIWQWLLLLVALLFPLDVAIRRVRGFDWSQVEGWREKIQGVRGGRFAGWEREQPRVLGGLFAARERVRKRMGQRIDSGLADGTATKSPAPNWEEGQGRGRREQRIDSGLADGTATKSPAPNREKGQGGGRREQRIDSGLADGGDTLERLKKAKKRSHK